MSSIDIGPARDKLNRLATALFCLVCIGFASLAAADLRRHPSPYLAMHGADPVDWREWGPEVLTQARRENKLILLSVGYFACHWCHVMQRESWRDPEVARLINTAFIPVKVDRELNAGLDASLQLFTERTRGVAGWPLNVFVTPEGYPLFAMVYAPRDEFLRLARALEQRWRAEGRALTRLAREAATRTRPKGGALSLPRDFLDAARREADPLRGGFGATSKFPMVPQLLALLEQERRQPDPERRQWLVLTLEQMRDGGLRDHVAGGFFRYTVDPDWHEPHFEKMLYDNAQLAEMYLRAGRQLGRPDLIDTGLEVVDFMLREMREGPGGAAFVASLSAQDGQGVEGGVYLWQPEQLHRLLSPEEFRVARRVWGLDLAATFSAGYLPRHYRPPAAADQAVLGNALAKLRHARAGRAQATPRDGKVLTGWNGLALAALAEAARYRAEHGRVADRLLRGLRERLWDRHRLAKGYTAGVRTLPVAELEDYAYLAYGAWRHGEVSGDRTALEFARALARSAWRDFSGPGGLGLEQASLLAGVAADAWEDGYARAPAAVLAEVSLALGDGDLGRRARAALARVRAGPLDYPLGRASLAMLPDGLQPARATPPRRHGASPGAFPPSP